MKSLKFNIYFPCKTFQIVLSGKLLINVKESSWIGNEKDDLSTYKIGHTTFIQVLCQYRNWWKHKGYMLFYKVLPLRYLIFNPVIR